MGKGEWSKNLCNIPWEEYYKAMNKFCPNENWAQELAAAAKAAGCRYITLTTRHHDGFSLFDTCGLNKYDAPHVCGRDLVREFVDACRANDIVPFFYHTLLDWHEESYQTNFKKYLLYLRKSVELLCSNYGKIGGLWFDGMWDKPEEDWEEDALYATIRRHQPEALIINNTGLFHQGALGHIELDSVTFERGRPKPINLADSPKYIASEMCETLADHWGYAELDFNFKSTNDLIETFAICRRYRSNFLLNVGPKADGSLRTIDKGVLEILGQWATINHEALHDPAPVNIEIENKPRNFLLKNGNHYYLFLFDISMRGDSNVAINRETDLDNTFRLPETVKSICWLDNQKPLAFTQEGDRVTVTAEPYSYGHSFVVRVAKITI